MARQGITRRYDKTSIQRMIDLGTQPHQPTPAAIADVLGDHLGYHVTVADVGMRDQRPLIDPFDGLIPRYSVPDLLRTVAELSRKDSAHRRFLYGKAFDPTAYAEPVLFVATQPTLPGSGPLWNTDRPGVCAIRDLVLDFRRRDHQYGSGRVRRTVVQFLADEIRTALRVEGDPVRQPAWLSALAEATWLPGWLAFDDGRHALAQRYFLQAFLLATEARDWLFAANVLSYMSRQAAHLGHCRSGDGRIRYGRHAVALARAAIRLGSDLATPGVFAMLRMQEARGLALLDERRACTEAITTAEHHFTQPRTNPDPPWNFHFNRAELEADIGHCFRDLEVTAEAAVRIGNAQRLHGSEWVRSRSFLRVSVATIRVQQNEPDAAAHAGLSAIDAAHTIYSTRMVDRLKELQRRLEPHLRLASVQHFRQGMAELESNALRSDRPEWT